MYLSTYCELPVSDSVEEAEARATLVRLHALAKVFGGPVELEMDCKTVTEYLNSDVPTLAPCYGVIQDIKAALSCFPSFKVVFTGRRSLVSFNTKLGKDLKDYVIQIAGEGNTSIIYRQQKHIDEL